MKFIVDVNIAQVVIKFLRQANHDVIDIKKDLSRALDIEIINLASKENRIILTHDKDFLGLSRFSKYQVGMILIRLTNQKTVHHLEKLKQLLEEDTEEALIKSLTILTEDTIEHYPYQDQSDTSKSSS